MHHIKKLIPGLVKGSVQNHPAGSSQTVLGDGGSNELCSICVQPLLVVEKNTKPFLDDIELPCLHHFHWECLYRWDKHNKRSKCPVCKQSTMTDGHMLVTVWDDASGEPQAKRNVDLGEMMDEERFYDKRPELKHQRMFLSLVAANDFVGAKKYLDVGVDIDTRWGHSKRCALHNAAIENDVVAIKYLLKWGAKRDLKDFQGYTALDLAKEKGATNAITALTPQA